MERERAVFAESLLAYRCNLQMRNQQNANKEHTKKMKKENNEHERKKKSGK